MATVTHAVTTPDTGNTPNTSGAFSPATSDLLVVVVTKEASALASPMVSADLTSSVAPTGFTLVRNEGHQSSAAHMGIFVADALTTNTTSRTVTIASGADAGAGTNIAVLRVAGMTRVGSQAIKQSAGQTDQSAGTPAPAFGAAALTANCCVGAIYNATNPAGLTPPSSWTEASDTGYTTGQVSGIETCFRNSGETGTTITWGSSSASAFASVIVELDTSGVPIEKTLTAALENDAAQALSVVKPIFKSITPGLENDVAVPLGFTQGSPTYNLTPVLENDAAQTLDRDKLVTLTPALEADAAQPLTFTKPIHKTLTPALEADAAQQLTLVASEEWKFIRDRTVGKRVTIPEI